MSRPVTANLPAVPFPPPVLARWLWQALVVGLLLVACLPVARGASAWIGPWPFWLVGAPLVALAVLYRQVLWTAWRSVLAHTPRRRRPRQGGVQARRTGFGRAGRQRSSRAA